LRREGRELSKRFRRMFQVMAGRKRHSRHVRLASRRGSQHDTKAGQTETVPPAHCFHASTALCKIVEVEFLPAAGNRKIPPAAPNRSQFPKYSNSSQSAE